MKKLVKFAVLTITLICFNNTSLSMDGGAQGQPLLNFNGSIPVSLYIAPTTLISTAGFFLSCLGSLLVYKGAQKTANPASTCPKLVNSTTEGRWLYGQGIALIAAGVLAIFNQKISG